MRTIVFKSLLALLATALLLVAALAFYFRAAVFHEQLSFDVASTRLEQHMQLLLPPGPGPHPAILYFHGCGGMAEYNLPRAQQLVQAGYAALMVDSMGARNLQMETVCGGRALLGLERASDVQVALEYIRNFPDIDHNNLFLQGFSHGGWSALEALALDNKAAPGLLSVPGEPLAGVRGAIIWYPYCGPGVTYNAGWRTDIPVLILLAEADEMAPPEPCLKAVATQQSLGGQVESQLYAQATHGFDLDVDWVINYDPETHASAMIRVLGFLSRHRIAH